MSELARLLVVDIVAEMPAVPYDDVLAIDGLTVHPGVELGLRADREGAIVDL